MTREDHDVCVFTRLEQRARKQMVSVATNLVHPCDRERFYIWIVPCSFVHMGVVSQDCRLSHTTWASDPCRAPTCVTQGYDVSLAQPAIPKRPVARPNSTLITPQPLIRPPLLAFPGDALRGAPVRT